MNLEASIQESIPDEMSTATIITLWALLVIVVYFVVNKTLRGFYKKSERKIEEHSLITQRNAEVEF